MNPAALITNVGTLEKGGTVIVNEDGFTDHNLRKAGYESNPWRTTRWTTTASSGSR